MKAKPRLSPASGGGKSGCCVKSSGCKHRNCARLSWKVAQSSSRGRTPLGHDSTTARAHTLPYAPVSRSLATKMRWMGPKGPNRSARSSSVTSSLRLDTRTLQGGGMKGEVGEGNGGSGGVLTCRGRWAIRCCHSRSCPNHVPWQPRMPCPCIQPTAHNRPPPFPPHLFSSRRFCIISPSPPAPPMRLRRLGGTQPPGLPEPAGGRLPPGPSCGRAGDMRWMAGQHMDGSSSLHACQHPPQQPSTSTRCQPPMPASPAAQPSPLQQQQQLHRPGTSRTSSGGRSGAAMRPLAASSCRSMRFLYSMSRRLPTIALLSLPAIALAKSLAPCGDRQGA